MLLRCQLCLLGLWEDNGMAALYMSLLFCTLAAVELFTW